MSILSQKLNSFKPSLTVKISQKARELKLQGKQIISLSSGEPDFDTPKHIKEQAIRSINKGFTKYTAVDGIIELKEAIKEKFINENKINYATDQITVGAGGKHVIYNLFMSTLNNLDEVIIPSPYWVSYPDIVSLCGGFPRIVKTNIKNNFKLTPDKLEENINEKTKWLIINSPSNPTGAVYSKDELLELSKILLKYKHVWILTDDIYEHLIYDKYEFLNILNIEPKLFDRTFIVNGVSKVFSMTGWRIGYGAGPEIIVKSISKIQSQSTTNPCSISQMAALTALNSKKLFLNEWLSEFIQRRNFVVDYLNKIDGLNCLMPQGAFYVFVSCSGLINKKTPNGKKIMNDIDFADYLIEYAGVAVVPGSAFGSSPYFRISYAASMKLLTNACEKIYHAISLIKD
ncbi:MAG: pyridoxal phosphate-dependent aminotransferase [Rickettsiales bacterium TMED254]|nr:aspartate aminotransferase [Rickettsiales bacterium]RPF76856.1 MAG: pyridoxal phosphate-dependent aminotransferase [Rickettsiales bacterium TMED254]